MSLEQEKSKNKGLKIELAKFGVSLLHLCTHTVFPQRETAYSQTSNNGEIDTVTSGQYFIPTQNIALKTSEQGEPLYKGHLSSICIAEVLLHVYCTCIIIIISFFLQGGTAKNSRTN